MCRIHVGATPYKPGSPLSDIAAQLFVPLVFYLSLQTGKVPLLWKTTCLVPVPKTGRLKEINDFRQIALTLHIMKTMEQLLLWLLIAATALVLDSLQFAFQERIGVDDAVLYMLHRAYSYLVEPGCYMRMLFLNFSSAYNTIRPPILTDKLECMGVDPSFTTWITNYLKGRP